MVERGVPADHTTVWRWVQAYPPEIRKQLQEHVKYIKVGGRWMYLFRAVDKCQTVDFYLSETRDGEAAERFLQAGAANPDNRPPHVMSIDRNRSYPAAIRELKPKGRSLPVAASTRSTKFPFRRSCSTVPVKGRFTGSPHKPEILRGSLTVRGPNGFRLAVYDICTAGAPNGPLRPNIARVKSTTLLACLADF